MEVVERDVVRAVVIEAQGRILLLRTHDPTYPELGTWWELPGGGIEPGESYAEAVVRELAEETGLVVEREQVGEPIWRRSATFRYRGERRINHELVVRVDLVGVAPDVVGDGRVLFEDEDYIGHHWFSPDEIRTCEERMYPGRLPVLLDAFLAGDPIDEPFEHWS
jgi:8-oxo-dGTP pyrophosphatase MutT (NUDIX family)